MIVMLMSLFVNSLSRLLVSRRFDDLAGDGWVGSIQCKPLNHVLASFKRTIHQRQWYADLTGSGNP